MMNNEIIQLITTNGLAVFLVVYGAIKGPKLFEKLIEKLESINMELIKIKNLLKEVNKNE